MSLPGLSDGELGHMHVFSFFFFLTGKVERVTLSQISCFPFTQSAWVLLSHRRGSWSAVFNIHILTNKRLSVRNLVQYVRRSVDLQEDWQKEGLCFRRWLRLAVTGPIRTATTESWSTVMCQTLLCTGVYMKGIRARPFTLRIQSGTDPRHTPQSLQHYVRRVNTWLFVEAGSKWVQWTPFREQLQAAHRSTH